MDIFAQPAPTTLEAALIQIEAWRKLALTDDLTQLHHRRAADYEFKALRQSSAQFIVFMIDLNKFKPVNDKAGHEAGDKVLFAIGQALRAEADTVCRWGGDEFLVIAKCSPADGLAIPYRLKAAMLSVNLDAFLPADMAGHRCGGSIGWADCSEADDLTRLVAIADERMYADKAPRL